MIDSRLLRCAHVFRYLNLLTKLSTPSELYNSTQPFYPHLTLSIYMILPVSLPNNLCKSCRKALALGQPRIHFKRRPAFTLIKVPLTIRVLQHSDNRLPTLRFVFADTAYAEMSSSPWKQEPHIVAEKVMKRAAVSQVKPFDPRPWNRQSLLTKNRRWPVNYKTDLPSHSSRQTEVGRIYPWTQ